MIFVDNRAGSCELVKPLTNLGLPVEEMLLDFGDVFFTGRGEGGAPVQIGIEHKKIADLIASMQSGRLQGHQLPGMLQLYDRSWLIIEGDWEQDTQGRVSMWKGKKRKPLAGVSSAVELEKRILTLETRGGFRVRICPHRRDTLRFICALYRYWTDVDLDEHKSHLAIHAPDLDRGLQIPISDFRRIVSQIPGIGLTTSQAVERRFESSFRRMMLATEKDWAEIDVNNKRLGASRARKIMEALR